MPAPLAPTHGSYAGLWPARSQATLSTRVLTRPGGPATQRRTGGAVNRRRAGGAVNGTLVLVAVEPIKPIRNDAASSGPARAARQAGHRAEVLRLHVRTLPPPSRDDLGRRRRRRFARTKLLAASRVRTVPLHPSRDVAAGQRLREEVQRQAHRGTQVRKSESLQSAPTDDLSSREPKRPPIRLSRHEGIVAPARHCLER